MPIAEATLIVGMLMQTQADIPPSELQCMARNIYHEARSENLDGQIAVAQVTMNRVASPAYPDSICAVVEQDLGSKPWDCQFSWTCDGASDVPRERVAYELSILIAIEVIEGRAEDMTGGALNYLTLRDVYPRWAQNLEPVGAIGGHMFFRQRNKS